MMESGIQPAPQTKSSLGQQWLNIPNLLTYVRILVIPFVLWGIYLETPRSCFFAASLFLAASATDFIDGWFARKFNMISTVGKFLDPLADKLLVTSTLIMLIPQGRIPAWFVVIIIAREITVTALRGIASAEGVIIAARNFGKYKTIFQMIGLAFLLFHFPFPIDFLFFVEVVDFHKVGMVVVVISLVFSVFSAADYFQFLFQEIRKRSS